MKVFLLFLPGEDRHCRTHSEVDELIGRLRRVLLMFLAEKETHLSGGVVRLLAAVVLHAHPRAHGYGHGNLCL